jgi:hypothetical protein
MRSINIHVHPHTITTAMGCSPSKRVKLSIQPYSSSHPYILRICGYTNSLYQTASSAVLHYNGRYVACDAVAHEDPKNATIVAYILGLDMTQTHTTATSVMVETNDAEFLNLIECPSFTLHPYYNSILSLENKFTKIHYKLILTKNNKEALQLSRDSIYLKSLEQKR